MIKVQSVRFGEVEVSEDMIITFSYGLPGFLEERDFAIIPCEEDNPFSFLQSLLEPNLTFVVVIPFPFFSNYEFALPDEVKEELSINEENLPHIVNIVNIPENPEEMTANLLAPVVINSKTRKAMQVVLEKSAYTTKHRLFPMGFEKQNAEGAK
ncbi:MAG: flagellar assembly protein FliW [Sporomusaceae bacterium]|nr:flagellar assembly protein FliW [Sporomusaceae bacterium]